MPYGERMVRTERIIRTDQKTSEFQKSFENKGRLQPVLEDIPVYLSKKKNMGLIGTVYQTNNQWIQKGFKI